MNRLLLSLTFLMAWLVGSAVTVESYDPSPDTELEEIPGYIYFSLSEKINGTSPTVTISCGEVSASYQTFRNQQTSEPYRNFIIYCDYTIKRNTELPKAIAEKNEFTVSLVLNDGTELAPVTYKLKPAAPVITVESYNPSPDTELEEIPERIDFTLSAPTSGNPPMVKITSGDESVESMCLGSGSMQSFYVPASTLIKGALLEAVNRYYEFTVQLTLADGTELAPVTYNFKIPEKPMAPVTLGYCTGSPDLPNSFLGEETRAIVVGAAIRIPATTMMSMKGGRITGVRFATASGLQRVYGWLRNSLDSPALRMESVGESADGWNEVVFSTPYEITGEEIYLGYSGYQPQGVKAIRTEGTKSNPNGCFLGIQDVWTDMSAGGYGNLIIIGVGEAFVADDDLMFVSVEPSGTIFKTDESMGVEVTVGNAGLNPVSSYSISYSIDGGTPVKKNFDTPLAYEAQSVIKLSVPMEGLDDGLHQISLQCQVLNPDVTDSNPENNVSSFEFVTYAESLKRTVLIEQFTTIGCVNCPSGARAMKIATEGRDDVVWIAHHSGFGTDELTIDCAKEYLDFGVVGAPSAMLDRTVIPGSGTTVPPFTIGTTDPASKARVIGTFIDYAASVPAFAIVDVTSTYDPATRSLSINVTGERSTLLGIVAPNTALTVYLTESDVISRVPQTGADENYRHNHAVRAILTPTFGNPITWSDDDDTFTATFTTTVNDNWVASNIEVVAVINKPFTGPTVSQVINSAKNAVNDPGASIDEINAEGNAKVEYFDLSGRKMNAGALTPGIYLQRKAVNGTVHTTKALIK